MPRSALLCQSPDLMLLFFCSTPFSPRASGRGAGWRLGHTQPRLCRIVPLLALRGVRLRRSCCEKPKACRLDGKVSVVPSEKKWKVSSACVCVGVCLSFLPLSFAAASRSSSSNGRHLFFYFFPACCCTICYSILQCIFRFSYLIFSSW